MVELKKVPSKKFLKIIGAVQGGCQSQAYVQESVLAFSCVKGKGNCSLVRGNLGGKNFYWVTFAESGNICQRAFYEPGDCIFALVLGGSPYKFRAQDWNQSAGD